jgi:glyceraldehyde 3-phosphate dehydrogenase
VTTTVGLVGFGRIGKNLFRLLYNRDDIRVGAIADLDDPTGLEYLLRFDTVLGRFPDVVSIKDGNLYVVGRQIPFLTGPRADDLSWKELGVDIVLEATARSRSRKDLEWHLSAGAKRVISLAPPPPDAADAPDLMVVAGVNDDKVEARHRIVSNASSTVHCVAPIVKILHEAFGIERAIFTTVHSYTAHHRLADVPEEDKRLGRAAAENIIPQASRSPRMVIELIPEMKGKLSGYAMNVPVRNGSAVDLVCWFGKKATPVAINEVVRTAAASERWKRIIKFEDAPIVSMDVALSSFSNIFDSLATMAIGERLGKTVSWYDSGFGYVHRAVELVQHFAALDSASRSAPGSPA